jgi:hypothetical protein
MYGSFPAKHTVCTPHISMYARFWRTLCVPHGNLQVVAFSLASKQSAEKTPPDTGLHPCDTSEAWSAQDADGSAFFWHMHTLCAVLHRYTN